MEQLTTAAVRPAPGFLRISGFSLWKLDLGSYNIRTLPSEMLFKELKGVKLDIVLGLSKVRKTGEEFIELKNGHIFCYREQERTWNTFPSEKITSRKY